MIKIKTESLREFQKLAQQIQSNTLLPICSNLKIEACVDALVRLWPGVVTKIRKDDGRIDAKINWKDIKSGQQSIQSIFGI